MMSKWRVEAHRVGSEGEDAVACYLVGEGFRILETNYRKSYGEIDIIAERDNLIVFVEVKARKTPTFEFSCVVTKTKQRKIALVAREYVTRHTENIKIYRFDIALVEGIGLAAKVTYIPHAFVIEHC